MNRIVSALSEKNIYPYIILLSAAFLLFFWALGFRGLWAAEDRWAEIVREMFLTGDFFHPTINGEPYFDKPLLSYWLIALVSHLTGRLDELVLRLPSAISGLLALWGTVCLGRRLWSEKVGITAGWILLTTYGVLLWSRTATANMENMTTIILALAWYWARRERQNCFTFLVFYLICFIGAQTKGLTAVVVPILAVLPDLLRERRWRAFLSFSHLLALAVGVFVYLAPFIYSAMTRGEYQSSGLALVFQENILRYFRPFDHKESFYVYLYYLPGLFLPWTPLLLIAFWRTFASFWRLDRRTRWLAEAVVVIFLFFTFSGSRRGYYILPILPLCALLVSVFLNTEGKKQQRHLGLILQTGLFIIISIVEILSLGIWPIIRARVGFIPTEDLKLAAPVLGLLALFPWILNRLRPGLQGSFLGINSKDSPCVVSAVILMGGFFCWQQVSVDAYRQERPFAMELKAQIAGLSPEQIAFYGTCKSYILFYLDLPGPVRILSDNESVRNYLESARGDKFLITKRKHLKDLESAFPARLKGQPTLSEKIYPWDRKINKKLVAVEIKAVENKDEQKDNQQNAPGRL